MEDEIILLGSSGLIGNFLHKYLSSRSYELASYDLKNGFDMSNEETVSKIMQKHKGKFLINCFALDAKVSTDKFPYNSLNLPLEVFNEILNVNVTSTFSTCQKFIATRDHGRILNISSIYGLVSPNPTIYPNSEKPIAYGVSKAAVIQLTRHLAAHFAPEFQINCLTLGGVLADQNMEFIENYSQQLPMKRMASLEEIVPAIEFFLSPENSYMTGSNIVIDGGWTII